MSAGEPACMHTLQNVSVAGGGGGEVYRTDFKVYACMQARLQLITFLFLVSNIPSDDQFSGVQFCENQADVQFPNCIQFSVFVIHFSKKNLGVQFSVRLYGYKLW